MATTRRRRLAKNRVSLPFTRSGASRNRRRPFFSRRWARTTKDSSYRAGFLYAVVRRCPANAANGSRAGIPRRRWFQATAVARKTSGNQPCIPMMKPANHRELDDLPSVQGLHLPRCRGVLLQRQMRAATVIVDEIISKNSPQVILAYDDHMVNAVSA